MNLSAARSKKTGIGGLIFVLFVLGVVLTLGLYFVKTRAQTAKAEAAKLQSLVDAEAAIVSTLKSELVHLESPARLEVLAKEKLGFEPVSVERVLTLDDLDEAFPLVSEDEKP